MDHPVHSGEFPDDRSQALLDRLATLAQVVGAAEERTGICRALFQFVQASVPCNGIFIALLDEARQERTCIYAWSEGVEEDVSKLPPLPMTGSPNSRAASTGEVVITSDFEAATANLPTVDIGLDVDPRLPQSSIVVPMKVLGRVIGTFEVQSVERAAYREEHVVALRLAGNLAAIALHSLEILERERQNRLHVEQSERQFRALFESMAHGVVYQDASGQILSANPAAERILGLTLDQMQGRTSFDPGWRAVQEDGSDFPGEEHPAMVALRTGQPVQDVLQGVHNLALGETRWIVVNSIPQFREGESEPYQVFSTFQDVTERAQRRLEQEALVRVAARLRMASSRAEMVSVILDELIEILKASGAAFIVVDPARDVGRIQLALGSAAPAMDMEVPLHRSLTAEVMQRGQPLLIEDAASDPRLAEWSTLRGGAVSAACVPLISEGISLGALWIGSLRRFSEGEINVLLAVSEMAASALRRAQLFEETVSLLERESRARQEAEQERARLQNLIDQAPAMMATVRGPEHRFEQANTNYLAAIGKHDVVGRTVREVLPELEAQGVIEILDRVYHERQPFTGTELLIHLDTDNDGVPEPRYFDLVYLPVADQEESAGILVHAVDVTHRVEARAVVEQHAEVVARLNTRLEKRLQRLLALQAIDRVTLAALDMRLILNAFLEQTLLHLEVDAAVILLLNPHDRHLSDVASRGFRARSGRMAPVRLGQPVAGQVALERRPIHLRDLQRKSPGWAIAQSVAAEGFETYYGLPLVAKGETLGVLELFHRGPLHADEEWLEFASTMAGNAAIAINNVLLYEQLQQGNMEMLLAYERTIEGWSRALDLRDKETEGHSLRVTEMTVQLARAMGMAEEALVHVRRGALLHDIGKMGIPDAILLKPGPLDEQEWEIMRRHPTFGYELLAPVAFLRPALEIPYCHHEKWDGTGYPRGLRGEAIPLAARVFAVVDVWDALLSDRPYRPGWPLHKVLEHIRSGAGSHFDPRVAQTFLSMVSR